MSWRTVRLPLLSFLAVLSIVIATLDHQWLFFEDKADQIQPGLAMVNSSTNSPVPSSSATTSVNRTTKQSTKTQATTEPTASSTNTISGNNQNTSNTSNSTGGNQISNPTTNPTAAPTQKPVSPTATPTISPTTIPTTEPANIQIWVKGWWYSNTGHQYSADGDIKIYNGNTLVTSGFYNSYEEPYKVSNMPTNTALSVYFYMGTCGKVETINTGNVSTLHQIDFSFHPTTTCL